MYIHTYFQFCQSIYFLANAKYILIMRFHKINKTLDFDRFLFIHISLIFIIFGLNNKFPEDLIKLIMFRQQILFIRKNIFSKHKVTFRKYEMTLLK